MEEANIKYKLAWEYTIKWLSLQNPRKSNPREVEMEKMMLQLIINIGKIFEIEYPPEGGKK